MAPDVADIIGVWSGVRPLLRADGKKPSEISRRDEIRVGPGPVVSIAGGKLTTYRRMAERVVQSVLELLRRQDCPGAGESALRPLVGGSSADQARMRVTPTGSAEPQLAERLWATYGIAAEGILDEIRASPTRGVGIGGLAELSVAEVQHAVRQEMAIELDDVLRRRSRVGMFRTAEACAAAADVAAIMGRALGWNAEKIERDVAAFRRERLQELFAARGEGAEVTTE
jgi:glycerol-3-phosphate dehydrogenase